MKQYPASTKYKKYHKVNSSFRKHFEQRSFYPSYGACGVQATECGKLTYKQLESCRRTLRRGLKKMGTIWIKPFTYAPITKKPVGARMGKGKGSISSWIAPVRSGKILFEINVSNPFKVIPILNRIMDRLPLKCKIIFSKY